MGLFTNTKRGCSVLELADFYVKCVVTNKVVTSTVNGQKLCFDASDLDELLEYQQKVLMCMNVRTRAYLVMSSCWN